MSRKQTGEGYKAQWDPLRKCANVHVLKSSKTETCAGNTCQPSCFSAVRGVLVGLNDFVHSLESNLDLIRLLLDGMYSAPGYLHCGWRSGVFAGRKCFAVV